MKKVQSNKEIKPDYEYWAKVTHWTLKESTCLLMDVEPRVLDRDYRESNNILSEVPENFISQIKDLNQIFSRGLFTLLPRQQINIVLNFAKKKQLTFPNKLLDEIKKIEPIEANSTIKKSAEKPHGNALNNAKIREEVLSAAIAILINPKSNCRNKNGQITATNVRKKIEENASAFWPNRSEPPLSSKVIESIISDAKNKGNKIFK